MSRYCNYIVAGFSDFLRINKHSSIDFYLSTIAGHFKIDGKEKEIMAWVEKAAGLTFSSICWFGSLALKKWNMLEYFVGTCSKIAGTNLSELSLLLRAGDRKKGLLYPRWRQPPLALRVQPAAQIFFVPRCRLVGLKIHLSKQPVVWLFIEFASLHYVCEDYYFFYSKLAAEWIAPWW